MNLVHEVRSPFDNRVLREVRLATENEVAEAVAMAAEAFEKTRRQSPVDRAEILQRVADGLEKRTPEFVELLISEAGKPRQFAEIETARSVQTFAFAAREALQPHGEILELEASKFGLGHSGRTERFPIGVILGITPFNFPLNLVAHKVAPCIATGNTMIVKPALKAPSTAILLGEVLRDAGMIAGQINVLPFDHELMPELLRDGRIKMISFTGSADAGWKLKAASEKKRVTLELGGNAAVVIHHDAEWRPRLPTIAAGAFGYAGQSCISIQGIYAHRDIYDEFKNAFAEYTRNEVRTGNPAEENILLGPMIDSAAKDRLLSWVDEAVAGGARLLTPVESDGNCVKPIIVENVPNEAKLFCEEAFGPVVVLAVYDDFEQALQSVNASRYGLQAGVFTESQKLAEHAFQTLNVGAVLINQVPTFRVENMPYGGVKDSGFGREGIRYAMEEMTELKALIVNRAS